MSDKGFASGIIIGFSATVLVAFVWFLVRQWLDASNAFNEPQKIIHTTDKTPAEIQRQSQRAAQKVMLFFVCLALFIAMVARGRDLQSSGALFRQIARILFEIVELLIMILDMVRKLLSNFMQ
jgi:hypothetical protein